MGTIKSVKCPSCNQQWEHYHGFGFIAGYYYCDKCGMQKVINFRDDNNQKAVYMNNECGKCECGGTFRADSETVLCPKCHIPAEEINDVDILWD